MSKKGSMNRQKNEPRVSQGSPGRTSLDTMHEYIVEMPHTAGRDGQSFPESHQPDLTVSSEETLHPNEQKQRLPQ